MLLCAVLFGIVSQSRVFLQSSQTNLQSLSAASRLGETPLECAHDTGPLSELHAGQWLPQTALKWSSLITELEQRPGCHFFLYRHGTGQGIHSALLPPHLPLEEDGLDRLVTLHLHPRLLYRLRLRQRLQLRPCRGLLGSGSGNVGKVHQPPRLLLRPGRPQHSDRHHHCCLPASGTANATLAVQAEARRCVCPDYGRFVCALDTLSTRTRLQTNSSTGFV